MKLSELSNSVETLEGVGPAAVKQFARLNIFTVSDLLSGFPRDYEDRTKKIPLKEFRNHPKVHTVCTVVSHQWFGYGRMKTLKLEIDDGTARAFLIAFNRGFYEKSLPVGSIVSVTGQFSVKYNELQSTSFEAERIAYEGNLEEYKDANIPGSGLLSIYPLTEGLSQKNYRKAVNQALRLYAKALENEIPENLRKRHNLLEKKAALFQIHCPENMEQLQKARNTLIYEELYKFEKALGKRIIAHRGKDYLKSQNIKIEDLNFSKNSPVNEQSTENAGTAGKFSDAEFSKKLSPRQKQLMERLAFSLTDDQKKVIAELNEDIDRSEFDLNRVRQMNFTEASAPFSMQRLIQGDVGSGKTLVCFFAALRVIDYGGQCALMAPTELLARQHAENAAALLEPVDVKVAFLTGDLNAKERGPLLNSLKNGFIDIVIGTHALFSSNVQYKDLQLAIIDEQHRFGVTQREAIVAKGRYFNGTVSHNPDLMMMSATPIPQSLALTVFGDLDVSSIRTMPAGRKSIQTYLTKEGNEKNVYEAVRKELQSGHQAYFVYPLINSQVQQDNYADAEKTEEYLDFQNGSDNENTASEKKSAEEMFEFLSKQVFPEFKCGLVHGKLDNEKQSEVLDDFQKNKIQLIVATTVVEVGVDVPNATCMVIENADKFGLAQLHQMRGRVGRSALQSYCFLIYSKKITETGKERLKALRQNTDGFIIAEEDLKLRGPGEINGTAQSGYFTLGIADPLRDKEMLVQARYDAFNELLES